MREVGDWGAVRPRMRGRRALWAAALSALLLPGQPSAQTPSACADPAGPDAIAGISPDGEVALASGRVLRLADLRFPDPAAGAPRPGSASQEPAPADPATSRFRAWFAALAGARVLSAAGAADRWDVVRGRLALQEAPGAPALDLAELIVAEGFALVDAGEAEALCRPELLGLEAAARRGRRGLWAGDMPLVAASETERLAGLIGRFTIVTGRVVSVGERPSRTYLNFDRYGTNGFTATIPKRSWALLRARGLGAEALRGREVRVRGTLEMWRGPVLEIVAADMLEPGEPMPAKPVTPPTRR